jgi:hypothetical protein
MPKSDRPKEDVMRNLPLIVAALSAALVIGTVTVQASGSGPAYTQVSSWTAALQNGNMARLTVTTSGTIPRRPDAFIGSNAVVGLAWVDLGSGRVFVMTIHPVLGRDSHQNPDSWHAHTATLAGGATPPNDYCVASIDSTPTAGNRIHGDTMAVNVRSSALPVIPSAFDAAVGFTIQPDSACGSGLAVRTVD